MNICDTDLLQNCLLHRTTELYASAAKTPSDFVFHLQNKAKLKHWRGFFSQKRPEAPLQC